MLLALTDSQRQAVHERHAAVPTSRFLSASRWPPRCATAAAWGWCCSACCASGCCRDTAAGAGGVGLARDTIVKNRQALQHYLGHKSIQHTVRYTKLSPDRFRDFWRD